MIKRVLSLPLWAWISFLLHVPTLIHGLGPSDPAPRAALVTLAYDFDLPAMIFSMRQLEDQFNSRYRYHWIFFSTRELSEDFKRLTSNATSATCIYEVIPDEHWNVPGLVDHDRHCTSPHDELDYGVGLEAPVDTRQRYRWNSGLFASEKRLKDYDWFWRIEPGTQLTHDINFDVFRFMRDNGIKYGFHRDALAETNLRALSPQVRSFIDKHPDLLHEEADVSWLFDNSYAEAWSSGMKEDEDSLDHEGSCKLRQRDGFDEIDGGDDMMISSLTSAFTSWISGIYPTFEIGSLALFRNPNHAAFFEHLDSADFYHHPFKDVPVRTLSASMFLPRQSILNFGKGARFRARQEDRLSQPEATLDPDTEFKDSAHRTENSTNKPGLMRDAKDIMAMWLACWEVMARDIERQEAIPGLMSGNTVIDERSFSLI
ncbi:hypothetical protein QQZ08_011111 [Neonectria magnoliae]|uniref:Uncharacterized protein n=1 Tax=Neonectria magnoliae TaxID=2732573 RepID=A0ABR1HD44_9HYPO